MPKVPEIWKDKLLSSFSSATCVDDIYFIPAEAGIKAKVLQKFRLLILHLFELSSSRFGPRIEAVRGNNLLAPHLNPRKGATP
jgi:hypothetical protein